MLCYLAPLEGITTHILRNACHRHFAPMDKYFTPFIVPASKRPLRTRELRDVSPENNAGLPVIPQILTNNPEGFLETAKALADLGYGEVNLNLGCPSGTVTSNGKGAGFLKDPEALDAFFDRVFPQMPAKLSVKTRLGWADPAEFPELLSVFNRYPLTEVILHARTRQEFYLGQPHLDAFAAALAESRHALVYNGSLFTEEDIRQFQADCPAAAGIMLGRGILAVPGLWNRCLGETVSIRQVHAFHDEIYNGYREILSGPDPVIHKMKELWFYMAHGFTNSQKYEKALQKTHRLSEYESIVRRLFEEEDLSFSGFVPPGA